MRFIRLVKKSDRLVSIHEPETMSMSAIAIIFGTKVSVCSCIWVAA